jgi:hypothetical protein
MNNDSNNKEQESEIRNGFSVISKDYRIGFAYQDYLNAGFGKMKFSEGYKQLVKEGKI